MKVAIIGAGALGLMLANLLEKSKIEYDIFNKGKVGRKILASGNGKCNISNNNFNEEYYLNNKLSYIVKNNQKELFNIFNELHIYTKEDLEGRMYPISESSQSVLNILIKNIKSAIDLEITNIKKINNLYYLNDNYGPYTNIVIAIGSSANFKIPYPSLELLNSLNLDFQSFYPTLVGFKTSLKIKSISGVRAKALVKLYSNKLIKEYRGEVIFKDDGISGICVMNLSTYYANIKDKSNAYISIDLLENKDYNDLESVLNPKLLKYVLDNKIDIHNFIIPIKGVYDLEFAQTAHGGININELNNNLSLIKDNNIYAGGEILNVDAISGGYNLMFAFSCAIEIWKSLNEIHNR